MEVFGPKHMVYVGIELTKKHEQHIRDTVERVIEQLEEAIDGSRIKGEVTLVLAPSEHDKEYLDILRES